jgi:hypothetical protein
MDLSAFWKSFDNLFKEMDLVLKDFSKVMAEQTKVPKDEGVKVTIKTFTQENKTITTKTWTKNGKRFKLTIEE